MALEDMPKEKLLEIADQMGIEGLTKRNSDATIIHRIREEQADE